MKEPLDTVLRVRFMDVDRQKIAAAVQRGEARSESDYIRQATRDRISGRGQVDIRPLRDGLDELVQQLRPIGGNLNQIARAWNSGQDLNEPALASAHDELRDALAAVVKQLRNLERVL